MIDFTIRQLRAFILVARHRSFTRAAGALFVTPSALSVLIRELETQLGVRLFERTTRQVALTLRGSELLAVAQRHLDELDAAVARVGRAEKEAPPSLTLGAPPMVAAVILPGAIKEFRSKHPGLHVQLSDGGTPTLLQQVEAGALDMALGVFFKHAPGLRRSTLFRIHLAVIRPDQGPSSRRATTTWSALKGEKLISLSSTVPLQQFVERQLSRAGVQHQPSMVVNYLNTQIGLVEAGEGVAIIPSYGLPASRNRRIVMSRLINPVVHLDFSQVRRGGKRLPPVAEEFTFFLQRYFAAWARRSGIM
jgi:LysR family transcriptional regulator, carnitine catabolism transcriptional activator